MAQPIREEETDSLSSLEERINRAVELVTTLRAENESLARKLEAVTSERDAARASAEEQARHAKQAAQDLDDLRAERKQVRTRIEKLLGQMDLLSNA
ncbi:MAG TPA: cell division protein ZapB [Bryobacteraceae bacterium]|jgi:FtsZ-binding cell division protein ZapB|nr:cell division protein ZapB [Bryobacteraceae bacterium]